MINRLVSRHCVIAGVLCKYSQKFAFYFLLNVYMYILAYTRKFLRGKFLWFSQIRAKPQEFNP